jgi:cobalamin biosynthesis protein CobD/CbiB
MKGGKMSKQIKVVVEKDGKMSVRVEGVTGAQCLSMTAFFEKEMGEVCDRRRTGDFYGARQAVLTNRITSRDTAA